MKTLIYRQNPPFGRKAADAIGDLTVDVGDAEVTDQPENRDGGDWGDVVVVVVVAAE